MVSVLFYIFKIVLISVMNTIGNSAFFVEVAKILFVSVGLASFLLYISWKSEKRVKAAIK